MIIDCPSCGRKLRVPDDLLGKQVKCPTCGYTFQASGTHASPTPAPAEAAVTPAPATGERPGNGDLDRSDSASALTRDEPPAPAAPPLASPEDLRPCPYCGTRIARDATRCGTCGEALHDEDDRPWEGRSGARGRRDAEPHRGGLILTLGIIGIVTALMCGPLGLVLGIFAWVMGQGDVKKLRARLLDAEGEGLTQAGWICGIIGTILGALCTVGGLVYFGFVFAMINTIRRTAPPRTVPAVKPAAPPPGKKADGGPLQFRDYLPGIHC